MRVTIEYSGEEPRISVGNLEGVLMHLSGRTEHVVSKDPYDDTLATWFDFYLEHVDGHWQFGYRSNRVFSRESEKNVLDTILAKANDAIMQRRPVDLSSNFNALDDFEPFTFAGLYARMDERHNPIPENGDLNRALDEMRKELKSHLSLNEGEADKHLRNFALQIPSEIIWIDHTTSEEDE